MNRRMFSIAVSAMAVLFGSIALDAPAAGAWTDGQCTDANGVTVVIDFQELGGGVNVRCAPGPVGNGFEALATAGIDYQTTIKFPGFLCKIAGKPSNDPCQTTSPATAYWSYWIAARGGQWCYSNWGAGNRTPPPGSVEGWSFSLNKDGSTSPPPRFAVPAPLPATSPAALPGGDCDPRSDAPQPTTPPATGGSGSGANGTPTTPEPPAASDGNGSGGGGSGGGSSDPGRVDPGTDRGAADAGAGTTPAPGAPVAGDTTTTVAAVGEVPPAESTTSTSAADGRDADDNAVRVSEEAGSVDLSGDKHLGGGSPVGVLAAIVLLVALGGGAIYVRRRATRV